MEKKKLLKIIIAIAIVIIVVLLGVFLIGNTSKEELGNVENQEEIQNGEIETIVDENELINNYLYRIYFGTNTYMPTFEDINSADENWIWECAYRNLVNFEELATATTVKKEDVEKSAKQLFGNDFNKEFPTEGLEFWLEPQGDEYFYAAASIEQDFYEDYSILSTKENGDTITVEIVEFKYNDIFLGEPTELNLYKKSSEEIVKTYSLMQNNERMSDYMTYEKLDEAMLYAQEHPEEFSTAKITLKQNKEKEELYVVSVKR